MNDESRVRVHQSVVIAACALTANVHASLAMVVQHARSLHSAKKFAQRGAVDTGFAKSVNVFANQALVGKIALLPRGKCALEKATAMATVNASTASASVTLVGQEKLAI